MEVLVPDFRMATPERSPNESPLSASPSPDQQQHGQHSGHHEQSLHIIVEPQIDGQTNFIHLINPPSGQVLSSFIAENGAHIEIQPGVLFRVPFPHEHGYPLAPLPHAFQAPSQFHLNMMPGPTHSSGMSPPQVTIPAHPAALVCPVHGSPGGNACQLPTGDERLDRRRANLQRKLREKNSLHDNKCSCYRYNLNPNNYQNGSLHPSFQIKQACERQFQTVSASGLPIPEGVDEVKICRGDAEDKDFLGDLSLLVQLKVCLVEPKTVLVQWGDCIANNNHLLLCQFELQMCSKASGFKTIYSGVETSYAASDLLPGTEYSFRLCAVLNEQRGPYSDAVSVVTLATVPDRPLPPRITQKAKNSVTLKWTVPADGGSPITAYKLQWNKGADDGTFESIYVGVQRQFKVSHKLPPGVLILFRLQASNEIGDSEFSQILECLTSAGPPEAPESPSLVKAGPSFVSLKWLEPPNNGAAVLEYKLEMEDQNSGYGFMAVYCGDQRQYTCQKLHRNSPYKFRLMASNSQGASKYSPPVVFSTLPEAPGAMDKPRAVGKIKTHSFTVTWEPPRDSGGDHISSYILEIDDGKGGHFREVFRGTHREFLAEGLLPGCGYRIRVAAEGPGGRSSWSPVATLTTLPVCPKAPLPPRLSKTLKMEPNALHLEWDPPACTGGAAISSYSVSIAGHVSEEFRTFFTGVQRYCSVEGLLPGTSYLLRVQASNSAGAGPWSEASSLTTAPGIPDAPDCPTVSIKSPTHLRLEWQEPASHGTPVIGYCVEKLENELFQKIYQGLCPFCEIKKGLSPATYYYFRVQAMSAAGPSAHSPVLTVKTPSAPPSAVVDIRVIEQTSSTSLIWWKHPPDNGERIISYNLEVVGPSTTVTSVRCPEQSVFFDKSLSLDPSVVRTRTGDESNDASDSEDDGFGEEIRGEDSIVVDDSEESSVASSSRDACDSMQHLLTGLPADASIRVRIQAVNGVGAGPFSHVIQLVTKELPPAPPCLSMSSSSYCSIKLKWSDATPLPSSTAKHSRAGATYTLQLKNKSGCFVNVYSGTGTSFTLSKLKELTPHVCRIRATNDAGEGEFSCEKTFYTKPQPPVAVKDVKFKEIDATSALLTWLPVDSLMRDDDSTEYIVQQLHAQREKEFAQIFRGTANKCRVEDLQVEQEYHFRVCAVRLLSAAACDAVPNVEREIKGAYSSVVRLKTKSDKEECPIAQAVSSQPVVDGVEVRRLSDSQVAFIILGVFLGICLFVAVLLKWVVTDY